jgi:hypothetical protein
MVGRIAKINIIIIGMIMFLSLFAGCNNVTLRDEIEIIVDAYNTLKSDGVVYVSVSTGDDVNPGTKELPRKTIQSGIDLVSSFLGTGEVHVAEGTYVIEEKIVLKKGVSIYGGFSTQNWSRNISTYKTIIEPRTFSHGSGFTIQPEENVTNDSIIDGFTVNASLDNIAVCIYCSKSSPTITNNRIDATAGTETSTGIFCVESSAVIMFNSIYGGDADTSVGISIDSASPTIIANDITGGKGFEYSWGIAITRGSPIIRNNVIYGGEGSVFAGESEGIISANASGTVIQNNTVHGGKSFMSYAIVNYASGVTIENNIIFSAASGAGNSWGIYEASYMAYPAALNNNDFFDCDYPYVYVDAIGDHYGAPPSQPGVNGMQTRINGEGVPASQNIWADPQLADQAGMDWHLSASSPLSVTEGGLNLSIIFTTDRDGTTRTAPWSIGAYEKE